MTATTSPAARNDGIDLVRGLVMVVMAIDHARDIVGDWARHPTDLTTTTVPLFFTRWITHFCAPVFVLLAGTAAFLYGARGRSRIELARFLVTRGLWLVVLELTVIRFGWFFDVSYRVTILQVIWAIGCCMIVLAGLIFLPRWAIALFGVVTIGLHDTLDHTHLHSALWAILHEQHTFRPTEHSRLHVMYPLVPWVGVMALGYAMGPWFTTATAADRKRWLWRTGVGMIVAFLVLRIPNLYGDPVPWVHQRSVGWDVLAVINCAKYPPSLSYLLMTLGPALIALALVDGRSPGVLRPLVVFGRVPMFYYILHLPLLHLIAGAVLYASGGTDAIEAALHSPHGTGLGLPGVYAAWITTVLLLYPVCAWYAGVKQRGGRWWLSYL